MAENGKTMVNNKEKTLIMIKPDGVQRGLVGKIIQRYEEKGFKLVAIKMVWPTEDIVKKHYAYHSEQPFFPTLVKYICSGPVVAMIWEGFNAVKTGRVMLGTHTDFAPGTIRGDYCAHQIEKNITHGSHDLEAAEMEIKLWFTDKEIMNWTSWAEKWIYQ